MQSRKLLLKSWSQLCCLPNTTLSFRHNHSAVIEVSWWQENVPQILTCPFNERKREKKPAYCFVTYNAHQQTDQSASQRKSQTEAIFVVLGLHTGATSVRHSTALCFCSLYTTMVEHSSEAKNMLLFNFDTFQSCYKQLSSSPNNFIITRMLVNYSLIQMLIQLLKTAYMLKILTCVPNKMWFCSCINIAHNIYTG